MKKVTLLIILALFAASPSCFGGKPGRSGANSSRKMGGFKLKDVCKMHDKRTDALRRKLGKEMLQLRRDFGKRLDREDKLFLHRVNRILGPTFLCLDSMRKWTYREKTWAHDAFKKLIDKECKNDLQQKEKVLGNEFLVQSIEDFMATRYRRSLFWKLLLFQSDEGFPKECYKELCGLYKEANCSVNWCERCYNEYSNLKKINDKLEFDVPIEKLLEKINTEKSGDSPLLLPEKLKK